ncbi:MULTISPECIES: choline-sulfatase [unclassified Mesorhizobium]|uniref:choline-sulfatase n=1 Tax=unclassified Mesorhizobium TaxID=325217 RepID=UPI001129B8BC|nr:MULTISPECIES: choline-sulfatase [unclassified Mesorhizobium]MBZ9918078.1 choline-sulfatase [Mesorhizobium sp. BR1-1-7]MBZ9951310.1 choline-sulfatase [Mesorhizobium sp. BR1-1-15]MBZ9957507.1 choline-sulfatase [Mesorhizobium sp. BR1-1-14]MBZ9968940.1 choline-sulfatase [Mesorhizobium sp. BR1-1-12]MBZ9982746.1 choline-sulfatase [Mesorhizobium sp. BR-1-1-8]
MTRKHPNFLIVMVDQLNGTFFPDGPADFLHAPHLKALAARSARFRNNYTGSPLCAPGRASFMSGQLPSRTGVYDNAAEFASSIPTFAHHLRAAGYHTCLSGKMHFVGPDQLHGFEERLTTDIYPADFGWTPDYRKPGERIDWWYHNLGSVTGAGIAETTNQMEYDDEVVFLATQKLYQLSREQDDEERRPWCLTVSLSHPHDPYVARKQYWDLYENCQALDPETNFIAYDEQDTHSQRLYVASDYPSFQITPEQVRRSRRGYFANISYVDDKLGELLDVLKRTRMLDDTTILFCSDHGDMLGERGLWFKMSFFEGSARVPLMIAGRGVAAGLIEAPVSNLDVTPTLCDLAGIDIDAVAPWTDGQSLLPLIDGERRSAPVLMEYAAEGSYAPLVAIREGRYKFVHCELDAPQLFDLQSDPLERENLAADPANEPLVAAFMDKVRARWDMAAFDAAVRESQARRWVVYRALRNGAYYPWDFQPLQKASERYMRNHMNLDTLEESKRYPRGE